MEKETFWNILGTLLIFTQKINHFQKLGQGLGFCQSHSHISTVTSNLLILMNFLHNITPGIWIVFIIRFPNYKYPTSAISAWPYRTFLLCQQSHHYKTTYRMHFRIRTNTYLQQSLNTLVVFDDWMLKQEWIPHTKRWTFPSLKMDTIFSRKP